MGGVDWFWYDAVGVKGGVLIDTVTGTAVTPKGVRSLRIISSRMVDTMGRSGGIWFHIPSIRTHKKAVSFTVNPPSESGFCGRSPARAAWHAAMSLAICVKGIDLVPRA